jgi:hypothetical protein
VKARFASGDSNFSLPNTGWRNVPAPANLAATDGTLPNGVGLSWTGVEQAIGQRFPAFDAGTLTTGARNQFAHWRHGVQIFNDDTRIKHGATIFHNQARHFA